jgi:hypothetical protein
MVAAHDAQRERLGRLRADHEAYLADHAQRRTEYHTAVAAAAFEGARRIAEQYARRTYRDAASIRIASTGTATRAASQRVTAKLLQAWIDANPAVDLGTFTERDGNVRLPDASADVDRATRMGRDAMVEAIKVGDYR